MQLSGKILTALLASLIPVVALAEPSSENRFNKLPDSKNQIMRLQDDAVSPRELRMKQDDSILFFLNETVDSLATLEIDYGKKETHCASSNLEILADGKVRSTKPFVPKDFASVCFHEKGTYPVKIYGLKKHPEPISATVIVE